MHSTARRRFRQPAARQYHTVLPALLFGDVGKQGRVEKTLAFIVCPEAHRVGKDMRDDVSNLTALEVAESNARYNCREREKASRRWISPDLKNVLTGISRLDHVPDFVQAAL